MDGKKKPDSFEDIERDKLAVEYIRILSHSDNGPSDALQFFRNAVAKGGSSMAAIEHNRAYMRAASVVRQANSGDRNAKSFVERMRMGYIWVPPKEPTAEKPAEARQIRTFPVAGPETIAKAREVAAELDRRNPQAKPQGKPHTKPPGHSKPHGK